MKLKALYSGHVLFNVKIRQWRDAPYLFNDYCDSNFACMA